MVAPRLANPEEDTRRWLDRFADALKRSDGQAVAELFELDGCWRDLVSFTWNITTLEGRERIASMVDSCSARIRPSNWRIVEPTNQNGTKVDSWLSFETELGRGRGYLRLRNGRAFTLLTALDELKGFEEPLGVRRAIGTIHSAVEGRNNWADQRQNELDTLGYTRQPYCLVVGGGQAGLALGARLRMLDVPTIIVDRHPRTGDVWRQRYKTLCLHDPVWYDHMPYMPFPAHWPIFTPKDKLGDWLEMYATVMELNCWNSTVCRSARFDSSSGTWTAVLEREGEQITMHPQQLVLATGIHGRPHIPMYPGQDSFKGEIQHSSEHPGPDAFAGKNVVVIGSNNSAHDISAALYEKGADVTMVQRSSSLIVRSETLVNLTYNGLYSEEALASGLDTEKADLLFASLPYKVLPDFHKPLYELIAKLDRSFYEKLEAVGFKMDFGDDDSGLYMKFIRSGSGIYIDVGASELISSGKISLRSGSGVKRLKSDAIVLEDGSELLADLLVLATGYSPMNELVAEITGQECADRVGRIWGLGSDTKNDPGPWEGELRNMWKPTRQPGLWFHGGNLHHSRHYSKFLALQIKARSESLDISIFD